MISIFTTLKIALQGLIFTKNQANPPQFLKNNERSAALRAHISKKLSRVPLICGENVALPCVLPTHFPAKHEQTPAFPP